MAPYLSKVKKPRVSLSNLTHRPHPSNSSPTPGEPPAPVDEPSPAANEKNDVNDDVDEGLGDDIDEGSEATVNNTAHATTPGRVEDSLTNVTSDSADKRVNQTSSHPGVTHGTANNHAEESHKTNRLNTYTLPIRPATIKKNSGKSVSTHGTSRGSKNAHGHGSSKGGIQKTRYFKNPVTHYQKLFKFTCTAPVVGDLGMKKMNGKIEVPYLVLGKNPAPGFTTFTSPHSDTVFRVVRVF
ncbi:hypothetical protein Tdes44962_MAKER04587 [Teratosphaeria destructans]|uniref:Uncharacterized protein n=1 Tax=Teratosphaeria destructans TaxID=418781 RepID=A0A9W7SLY2_9PEZI|nr:hypothetical protein Tdes44962_MAKER04587 [Teratosphaeria destructans]